MHAHMSTLSAIPCLSVASPARSEHAVLSCVLSSLLLLRLTSQIEIWLKSHTVLSCLYRVRVHHLLDCFWVKRIIPTYIMPTLFYKRLGSTSYVTLCVSCHFLCRSPFCEEIVCCRGDHVRLAVRVRVFAYPENACAVWLMFACKYRSVLWPTDRWRPKTTSSRCSLTPDNILDLSQKHPRRD